MSEYVMGVDISMSHGAFVVLKDGRLSDYWFVADRKKTVDKSKGHGRYFFPVKLKDMTSRDMMRLVFWEAYLPRLFGKPLGYVGIEGYAYNMPMNSHQLGEIGGQVRLCAWKSGVKIRIHDPSSVKIFVAHEGSAGKPEVMRAVKLRWPKEAAEFALHSDDKYAVTEEDLCDALGVAQMTWTEIELRRGTKRPRDLHEQELRVFNRCTKRWPTSLLDRDWLQHTTVQE